jgi:hypothetical protein
MTDFYSVLKNSIVRRDLRSPADRLEVYEQAREAMIRKLWSFNPPLAEDEIDTRIGLFDAAVERIEDDLEVTYAQAEANELRRLVRRETPSEPPRQPLVYEGYDEEADYMPAFGGRPAIGEADYARPSPVYGRDDEDEFLPARHGYERYWEDIDEPEDERAYRRSDEHRQEPVSARRISYEERWPSPEPANDTEDEDNRFDDGPLEDAAYVGPDNDYEEPEYAPAARDVAAPQTPTWRERGPRPPDHREFTEQRPATPVAARVKHRNSRSRWQEPAYDDYDASEDRYAAFDRSARTRKKGKSSKTARGKRNPVRVLIITIAGLVAVLIGFNAYVFLPIIFGSDTRPPESASAPATTPPKIDERVPITAVPAGAATRIASDSATASEIPERNLDVEESLVVFDGRDPTVFEGTSNNPIQFDSDADGGFARVSSATTAAGARVVVGPGLAERLSGRTIRVTMLARSSVENGAVSLRFAYQSGLAISHWQSADLSSNYGALGMIWRVPAAQPTAAGDYILIEPGIPGDGTSTDIRSIKIDILAP